MKIPNAVYEGLMLRWRFSQAAFRVLSYIIRQSWGWNGRAWTKEPVRVSQIVKSTGLDRTTVWKKLNELKKSRIIKIGLDRRVRVNRCMLADRSRDVAKRQRCQSTTLPSGNADVVKRQRKRCQTTTTPLPSGNAPTLESVGGQQVGATERQLKTRKTVKETKGGTESRPSTRVDCQHQERTEFIGYWKDQYQRVQGREYVVLPGEFKAVARFLNVVGLDQAKVAARNMIASDDPWVHKNTNIAQLERMLNRFLGGEDDQNKNESIRAIDGGTYARLHQPSGSVRP